MKVGQTDRQMNWQTDKWHTGGFQQTTKLCAGGHINYFALKYATCKCNCISFIVAMTTVCTKQNKLIFSLCEDT